MDEVITLEVDPAYGERPIEKFFRRLGQFLCGLRGHDAVLHFERKRMMMRCSSCGTDSPGWDC